MSPTVTRSLLSHRAFSAMALAAAALCGTAAHAAAEPASCQAVKLASPGWTDIDATNAITGVLLKALGYQPSVTRLSVPMAYQGLRNGQIDAFLGNWMPAQSALVEPLLQKQQIELLGQNLDKARFTLAVPAYAAEAGVKSFADLDARGEAFSRRIYGIEAGAPANESIKKMIGADAYGLGDWKLVESSDTGLLSQLGHDIKSKKMVVFLAWEPHIMNSRYPIHYLSGGESYFGADGGAASVRTVSRPGYKAQCGNVGRLLSQLAFTVDLENQLIAANVDGKQELEGAAKKVLSGQPELLRRWLDGVTARDGREGWSAVQAALNLR